jgi:hypothetical protein
MADQFTPSEQIPGAPRVGPTPPIGEEGGKTQIPTSESFKSFMQTPGGMPATGTGKTPLVTPFDLAQQSGPKLAAGPTMQTLLTQAAQAQVTLGDISTQLNTPKLSLKQSQKYLLKNKLTSANAHLRSANSKLGIDPLPAEPETPSDGGPIGKFLGYVTDGQNQLQAAQGQLQELNKNGSNVNPADLLLVQIKLNKAQQELEYSSILLSNAVSDIKMLFGIQL